MNIVITSGNINYFDQIKMFVSSIRSKGKFDGEIILCDNTIGGTWNQPTTFIETQSFTEDQMNFFKDSRVSVVCFHDLLKKNSISREKVEEIKGYTTRYPFKFIYCSLISKSFLNKGDCKVIYFDSDIIFQDNISELFNTMNEEKIYLSHENSSLKESSFLKDWLKTTDFSYGTDQRKFYDELILKKNFCSGFIGGSVKTFNSFNLLCWTLASNRLTEFHTDQPLVNILIHYFNYPIFVIESSLVFHLSKSLNNNVRITNGKLLYNETIPVVVHFNGGKIDLMKQLFNSNDFNPNVNKVNVLKGLILSSSKGRKIAKWLKKKFL